ncbi:MAG: hypothetical protein EZS28_014459, partial [Streblomastix strix]
MSDNPTEPVHLAPERKRKIANSLKEKLLEQRREELAQEAAEQAAKDNGNNILEKTKDF